MAVVTETESFAITLRLNNGSNADGTVKTIGLNLGKLNKTTFDAQKVVNIVKALTPCLDRRLYSVVKTEVSTISEE